MIIIKHMQCSVTLLLYISGLLQIIHARSATTTTHQNVNGLHVQHKDGIAHSVHTLKDDSKAGSDEIGDSSNTIWKDLSLVFRIYQQCASENLSVCLKVKLLTGLEKAFRTVKNLKLIEGVQFVKAAEEENTRTGTATDATKPTLNEKDIEATLPRALNAKEHVLNNMIFTKLAGFLQDHTLQVKFPDIRQALDRADTESGASEGRGHKKDKKGGGAYIMIPLLLGGTFIPIAFGALAMLAGKALIVSKLALVLASIIGIKKLLGGGGKESQHEVVVQSGGHSGWGRDFDLAYSGWKPAKDAAKVM